MTPLPHDPEDQPVLDEFWKEIDEAVDSVGWVPVPNPVTFAEVFSRLLNVCQEVNRKTDVNYAKKKAALSDEDARYWVDILHRSGDSLWLSMKALRWIKGSSSKSEETFRSSKEKISHPLSTEHLKFFWSMAGNAVRYSVAREFLNSLKVAEEQRIVDLQQLLTHLQPTPKTEKFLERVSRCYLFGFDLECLIVCRSVLDSELEANISTDDCITHLGKRRGTAEQLFGFVDRIGVATKMGRLTYEQAQLAHLVRKNGNQAVHQMHWRGRKEVLKTMEHTIELIKSLTGEED